MFSHIGALSYIVTKPIFKHRTIEKHLEFDFEVLFL
jgi:hypothetical protein